MTTTHSIKKPIPQRPYDSSKISGKRTEAGTNYGGWTHEEHIAFIKGNLFMILNQID